MATKAKKTTKAAAKKSAAKKAATKTKAAAKKTATKKSAPKTKKPAAKKAATKKTAAKKTSAKKTATKKTAAKKPAAKKTAAKKPAAKKAAAKKAAPKPVAKKSAAKKETPKKTATKAAEKPTVKKTAAKPAAKKTAAKKAATKKVSAEDKPAKKAPIKIVSPKKLAAANPAPKPAKAEKPEPKPEPAAKPLPPTKPSKLEFKAKEYVVYPAHGVGMISSVDQQEIAGHQLELYVITFEKDKMTLRVPTNKSDAVGMRKLSEPKVINDAITTLKGKAKIKRTMWSRRAQEYEAKINSGDLISIAEVVRDLYRSDKQPEQSYSERQLYEAAIDRMAREVAAAESMDDDAAIARLEDVLQTAAGKAQKAAEKAAAEETAS